VWGGGVCLVGCGELGVFSRSGYGPQMDRPQTRYARSDDVAIAYQVHGSGDHDLLVSMGPFSNIGTMWEFPEAHQFFERLGRFARVIRYDRRDSGLSHPIMDDWTLESHARDADASIEPAD